jgi:hypothetical protein
MPIVFRHWKIRGQDLSNLFERLGLLTVGDKASQRPSSAPTDACSQCNYRQKDQYLQHHRPEVMPDKGLVPCLINA